MENSCVCKTSDSGATDISQHLTTPASPALSYMLLCELLKMDLYNHNDPDHISVIDMMDDRNDLDCLFLNSDRQDCGLDPKLEPSSVLPVLDAMDTGVSSSDTFGEFEWIQGLQTAAIAQLHQLSETENTDPNLLVNPQTAIPVHLHQPEHTQVRDAMLTENLTNNNINVIVSSSPTTTLTNLSLPNTVITAPNGFAVSSQNKNTLLSPSESSPVLVGHLQNGIRPRSHITVNLPTGPGQGISVSTPTKDSADKPVEKVFPKPVFSYSCLIALALKNSRNGSLPVSEIYNFMTENFPYFKTAPDGWKNSVRHNLSLNKCFEKVENPKLNSNAKKGCLWALNPAKKDKMEEEIAKGSKKDPAALKCSMAFPERLEKIERGEAGLHNDQAHQSTQPESPCRPVEPAIPSTPQTPVPAKTDDLFASELRDLHVLDSNFTLDTSLSDLAMQHGLWDDDLASELGSDLTPHVTMATVGSPAVSTVPSGDESLYGATYHGTCLYTSSPLVGLRPPSPASLTATLLSLASPGRTVRPTAALT